MAATAPITHEQLSVETGAFFQGRSLKFQRATPVALAAPEPEAHSACSPASGRVLVGADAQNRRAVADVQFGGDFHVHLMLAFHQLAA